ncbi:MAG: hypothetical protein GMKNLPBB_00774 [Myxococcota bacterium]|nr:hypothetical protein [Myxococcota bacterium]
MRHLIPAGLFCAMLVSGWSIPALALTPVEAAKLLASGDESRKEEAIRELAAKGNPGLWMLTDMIKKESQPEVRGRLYEGVGGFQGNEGAQYALTLGFKEEHPGALVGVIRGVARMKARALAGNILNRFGSSDENVRLEAARAIASFGPEMKDKVSERAESADPRVRATALTALGMLGAEDSLPLLIRESKSKDPLVARAAAFGIAGLKSPAAFEALMDIARTADDSLAVEMVRQISGYPAVQAVDGLTRLTMACSSLKGQELAVEKLTDHGAAGFGALVDILPRTPPAIRGRINRALIGDGSRDRLSKLALVVTDENIYRAVAAGNVLLAQGSTGEDLLFEMMADPNPAQRKNLTVLFTRAGDRLLPRLHESLGSSNLNTRLLAIDILGQIGAPESVDRLAPLLRHENRDIRAHAMQALARYKSGDVFKHLEFLVDEGDQGVREKLYDNARADGGPWAVKLIIRGLKDPRIELRTKCMRYLGELRATGAVVPLKRMLQDVTGFERKAVVQALGEIGVRQAIEPLQTISGNEEEDPDLRKLADFYIRNSRLR